MFIITHKSAKQNRADTKEESHLTDVRYVHVLRNVRSTAAPRT